ncbi:MAG TPA: hypothetical protein VJN21_02735 [Candidatus Acidoferrales bacterium]|nr:hypothetical protein [Candidatus Acidoferrales bacterium]
MERYRYLRAYMAGIAVPTIFLLVAISAFTFVRFHYRLPLPLERVIVYPMAVIPNLWGVWNMLYAFVSRHRRVPIGIYGATLLFVIVPIGLGIGRLLGFSVPTQGPPALAPVALLTVYYLVWKYIVGFLNRVVGVA